MASTLREGKESDPYYTMFDSLDEEEEGAINEPREITNDLDRQQELSQAARQKPGSLEARPVGQEASINQKGYWPPEESFGADLFLSELKAPRGLTGGHTYKGAYERALVQKEQLFTDNIAAARCVLLAQHQILLKDFTTCRKKPENRGGLYPVWGYPWVLPENCPSWSSCEDMFWAWVETLKYSPTELPELREDRLLSKILDQRDLCIRFVHLGSKRQLPRHIQKRVASSAHDERGFGVSSTSVPRSGKKPRTTYEAASTSVPRSRQSSSSLPGAIQSAPMTSRSGHNPSTSHGAGAYRDAAAPGVPAPRGSGPLRSGQGGTEVP
ncbi:hypothetical protein L916_13527, partial [Phytophthora nicotianae]